jgi:alginate O-acetyltransferase complex protein AlgI
MWFLQTDILVRILLAMIVGAVALMLGQRLQKQAWALQTYLILDLLLIAYVSKRLLVFYVGYVLITYGFVLVIEKLRKARRFFFVLLCLGCTIPFFYTRATDFLDFLPYGLAMVGIAYNMLKAVDALYYTYYTDEHISFFTYANYILFFPVITAGPIFRYRDFAKTLKNPEPLTASSAELFSKRFIRGMFKKVVVLVFVMKLLHHMVAAGSHWYLSLAVAALSYLTLYLDMSGYADIAISVGGVMGLRVPENFKNPLKAPSFTQFWRNWHITLSDWIREHVFVVVSGKKLSRYQGALIGFFTMFFMCLWHGFSIAYLVDGVLLGLVLSVENLFGITTVNKRKVKKSYYVFRCVITNVIFALNSLLLTLGAPTALQILRGFLKW